MSKQIYERQTHEERQRTDKSLFKGGGAQEAKSAHQDFFGLNASNHISFDRTG